MAKKRAPRHKRPEDEDDEDEDRADARRSRLHPDVRRSVWGVLFLGASSVLLLASFGYAGPVGEAIFENFSFLFGFGYYLVPLILCLLGFTFLTAREREFISTAFFGALLFVLSGLGAFDVLFPGSSGVVGSFVGGVKTFFGHGAGLAIALTALTAGALITLNLPVRLRLSLPRFGSRNGETSLAPSEARVAESAPPPKETLFSPAPEGARAAKGGAKPAEEDSGGVAEAASLEALAGAAIKTKKLSFKNYFPPPLSLLRSSVDKPTAGDLRMQANTIKRTLESFGIPVEMGEITIGPKVTRYTLKPAEGVKLARIIALNQDLALALAAHPLRIEAPIPGKSLVGIEVPNKTAAIVRLGSILGYPEFTNSQNLTFAIGRDIAGEPIFADIAKMPHLLIAGSTGSGKSVAIHSLITSLLFKNSPETLQLILIDPKRVELSIYRGLPHLASPVITEGKKAIAVLRWAISEMDRRYERLLEHSCRDIQSYNGKFEGRGFPEGHERMPYLLIVLDELADLMTAYGREVEASIVRLAQMARATGIHLVVSTQRPSVEVITGLIKANITSRVALQVASQVDSRTILDMAGAEKLLGGGDMLFMSSELSKPKRIQGAFVTSEEISAIVDFIIENNEPQGDEDEASAPAALVPDDVLQNHGAGDEDDDLYLDALQVVAEAKKASASLLQRRLKVGYARAARLLDLMEAKGIIGPGDGAKPREVFIDRPLSPALPVFLPAEARGKSGNGDEASFDGGENGENET